MTATVRQASRVRFEYLPADATVTVGPISHEGLAASVTALYGSAAVDLTPDKARTSTVAVAFTASEHVSTGQITVTAGCQTGYRSSPDGTCQALSQELPDSFNRRLRCCSRSSIWSSSHERP
ncbi:hypothetical protein [Candidatus Poriferisodalis sp.]|uniref:hypothetical protein n=1 Tax=Candidatus Poriferisodalis sp. TaxID=3101277 RepID=UPI003B5BA967